MVILTLKTSRSHRELNSYYKEASRPGWCEVLPCCSVDIAVYKFTHWYLTFKWVTPTGVFWLCMCSKVPKNWLLKYIKVMLPILMIFKMVGQFPNKPNFFFCSLYQNSLTILSSDDNTLSPNFGHVKVCHLTTLSDPSYTLLIVVTLSLPLFFFFLHISI